MKRIQIIIVDDHAIVRDGIKSILSFYKEIEVLGLAANFDELMALLDKHTVDIVLLDIEMPGKSGLEIAAFLQEKSPEIKKIIMSAFINYENVLSAIDAGVLAIMPKDINEDELYFAIKKAVAGEHHYSSYVNSLIVKNYIQKDKIPPKYQENNSVHLSEREIEVIQAFSDGLSYKEIADRLFISPRTVESHKNRILDKLGLFTIIDLVKYAIKNNLIDY
jgi:DNA-binding NarL/FixJ family response regulator